MRLWLHQVTGDPGVMPASGGAPRGRWASLGAARSLRHSKNNTADDTDARLANNTSRQTRTSERELQHKQPEQECK